MMESWNSVTLVSVVISALVLSPLCILAQDENDDPAVDEKPAAVQAALSIELGAPFRDHAILQRGMLVPVWGWSKPGTKITLEFAGQHETAEAGKDGKWMVTLKPLKASAEPADMLISDSEGKKVLLKNILVGEVWMASGQSNMQWMAGKSDVAKIIAGLSTNGKQPLIREFQVTSVYSSLHPIEKAHGSWKQGDFATHSAVAFAFAHKLYEELQVPIGILNCSFSQTSIEAWTPRCGFADGKDDYTKSVYQKILESDPTTPEHKTAWNAYYQAQEEALKANAERVKNGLEALPVKIATPGNVNDNRAPSWMFNGRLNPVIPYALRGCIWNQGYANINGGLTYYDNLHSLIRGWRACWNRPDLPVYFHQFYCPNGVSDAFNIESMSEMRLGAWLARDIPNTGMASQIDVTGAIHYYNKAVPGQRLALHALKNQYGKAIVADGPMFKSYKVQDNQVVVEFDFAQGGLVVAETGANALGKEKGTTGFSNPKIMENSEEKVKLFYLADENRVWYRASMKIDNDKVIVTSPKVKSPRGVAYATGGVGFVPNLYNRALLPMTPFIYYDHKQVTAKTWPDALVKVDGVTPDLSKAGLLEEYRKMPLLSSQFVRNAVLQADQPVTIWGSALHDWGYEVKGTAMIQFSFAGVEKTIPVTPGMREWQVTLPPMKASAEPKTLKVAFTINGELAHERVCTNVVFGDVWYVAAPAMAPLPDVPATGTSVVRVMKRQAKRSTFARPSRYSVSVSMTPDNKFASRWEDAQGGLAAMLGRRLAEKSGRPVGIIFMQGATGKDDVDQELKSWISADALNQAPSLMEDYKSVIAMYPGNPYYDANVRRYVADWKKYWGEYIPEMIATKKVPDGKTWGTYPSLANSATPSEASQGYNVMVCSFTPARLKGILFISSPKMVEADQGANYGSELSVLANDWKKKFGSPEALFFYTIPSKELAPKVTKPEQITGKSDGYEMAHAWTTSKRGDKAGEAVVNKQCLGLIDFIINEAYK